jgi:hypothetical protein
MKTPMSAMRANVRNKLFITDSPHSVGWDWGKRIRNLWRALLLEWDGRSLLLYKKFVQKSMG